MKMLAPRRLSLATLCRTTLNLTVKAICAGTVVLSASFNTFLPNVVRLDVVLLNVVAPKGLVERHFFGIKHNNQF
jgi:hypothetical protein